ncbi:MAG: iron-containing alcohol dehydrogenase [Chloroflexi bacterium]|nr:iron-containing alcohol dehydrogenase [Chloroflexota bacterium]
MAAGEFAYQNPARIVWGTGSLERLAEELDRLNIRRPFVVSTRSVAGNDHIMRRLQKCAGRTLAGVSNPIGQHAPQADLDDAIRQGRDIAPDGIVSVGGGSPIDSAKIVAFELGRLPHLAVPTTLSVAELAPSAGVTDAGGQKTGRRDLALIPEAVIYNPELALQTPLNLWLSTGIRALDHAVETILDPDDHPYSDTLSGESIRRLFASLPQARARPGALEVRSDNQVAAWLGYSLPRVAGGLSHIMGKQIGSPFGIPHGVTSCLLLPHVIRYRGQRQPDQAARLARAMGAANPAPLGHGNGPADAVFELIGSLGLPQRLRDFNLTDSQLQAAAQSLASDTYPAADILAIYRAAF